MTHRIEYENISLIAGCIVGAFLSVAVIPPLGSLLTHRRKDFFLNRVPEFCLAVQICEDRIYT